MGNSLYILAKFSFISYADVAERNSHSLLCLVFIVVWLSEKFHLVTLVVRRRGTRDLL